MPPKTPLYKRLWRDFIFFARTTFAWFTSKDEVTNRLTANADYGVSIVESFAPPKNWIPGQTVNKDVYAVNTGNIDAFVKTDVSGVVNMTYENLSTTFNATKAVKLTLDQVKAIHGGEDGFKTHEAGGWLAWTDATGVDTGSINEGRTGDVAEPWTPTENGVYVFRRAINKVSENNPFTYSGYYYKDGEYYKINLGDDTFPAERKEVGTGTGAHVDYVFDIYAESTDLFGANATDENFIDQKTGTIKSPVNYMYVVEEKVIDADVNFTFDAANKRLIAEYEIPATTVGTSGTYDAKAEAARAQVDYENARGKYDAAVASYNNAVANKAYAKALAEAEQALYDAMKALEGKYNAAHETGTGTEDLWKAAQTKVNDAAKYVDTATGAAPAGFVDGSGTRSGITGTDLKDLSDGIAALAPTAIMPDEFYEALNGTPSGNQYVAALNAQDSALRAAYNNYVDIFKEIYGNNGAGDTSGLYYDVTQLLLTIKNNTAESDTGKASTVKAASATLETKAGTLSDKMEALKAAYTALKNETNNVTGLDTSAEQANLLQKLTDMVGVANDFDTNATALDSLVDALVTAENNYDDDKDELAEEQDTWKKAIKKYNDDVTAAKKAYNSDVAADNSAKKQITDANAWDNNDVAHVFEDRSDPIVKKYSAIDTTGATDPVIIAADVTAMEGYQGQGIANYTLWPSARVKLSDFDSDNDGAVDAATYNEDDFATNDLIGVATANRAGTTAPKTIAQWDAAINTSGYKAALEAAKATYDVAKANSSTGHAVKFYVNLDQDYAGYWQIDAQDQDKKTSFDFYYKYVLAAGETAKKKLIDSVTFDSEIEAGAYKNLTFDLNVGLDSVQVTYDDSQNLYKTDAVDASNEFTLKVVDPTDPFDAAQVLTWG